MRSEWEATYVAKFDSPFSAYLDGLLCEGHYGATFGDDDGPGQVAHLEGRHVLFYSSTGTVTHMKMERGVTFDEFMQEQFADVLAWEHDRAFDPYD